MGGKGKGKEGGKGGEEVAEGQGMGEWKGRGTDAREREGEGGTRRGGEGRKVRTPHPSIPAYAPECVDIIL